MRESWEGLRSGRRGGSVGPYGQETFTLCTRQPRRSPLSSMGCTRHPEAEKARPPGRAIRRHDGADYPHHASIARRRSSRPTAGAPSPLTLRVGVLTRPRQSARVHVVSMAIGNTAYFGHQKLTRPGSVSVAAHRGISPAVTSPGRSRRPRGAPSPMGRCSCRSASRPLSRRARRRARGGLLQA